MKALFINAKDVKTFTSINGNLDPDRTNAVYYTDHSHSKHAGDRSVQSNR